MAQAQKALDLARITRSDIRAEERRALRHLGQGNMRLRTLEAKVIHSRKKLRFAECRIADLQQELLLMGVVVDDRGIWAYATSESHRRGPFVRAQSSTSGYGSSSSVSSSTSQGSYDMGCDTLQEPIAKLDVVQWSQATLPCEDWEAPFPTPELSPINGMSVDGFLRSVMSQQPVG